MSSLDDAQKVLDAFHKGDYKFLGRTSTGNPVIQVNGVQGMNNNPGAGFANQPTNTFQIKGSTGGVSVVPMSPSWRPR